MAMKTNLLKNKKIKDKIEKDFKKILEIIRINLFINTDWNLPRNK